MISLFKPFIPKEAILKEIEDTLNGRWIGQGPKVDRFEREFSKYMGYDYCLFVNSCTSALELAYHLLGISSNDEVIVPVLNCTAGQTGLLRRGAKIVFADITDDLTMDYANVRQKVTEKTKAIVVVHLGGVPCDERIFELGIPVIVDAAQHMVGPLRGDYICYSFQAIKHITTADGGMLVVKNKEEYDRVKKLRWFGIDRELKNRLNFSAWKNREMTFDINEAGYKYQPTDIDACFGLAALPCLPDVLRRRKEICEQYNALLHRNIRRVYGGSHWLFGILTENRDDLAEYLTAHDIENNLVHLRNDIYEIFGGIRQDLPGMNRIEPLYLYLPLHQDLSNEEVSHICHVINEYQTTS